MAQAMPAAIEEGFICPGCLKDLRSPDDLLRHFQEVHSEEQLLLNLRVVKELYGKAKKKILKLDEGEDESFSGQCTLDDNNYENYSDFQDIGLVTSHTNEFKTNRRNRLDHQTTETNKLIIRLDRLLKCDKLDRRQQEQELVAWIDGTTVTRCPSCAASFNITRRQHHCRLCGCIMCNSCSNFLTYDSAQTIVAPVHNIDLIHTSIHKDGIHKLNDTVRICVHCSTMLDNRRRAQIRQIMQPVICQLYGHLQMLKLQTESSIELYQKMYNSITAGESTFQIQDAQSLRGTIAKKAEILDVLSKKIVALPTTTSRDAVLHNNIKKSTSNYIKTRLLPVSDISTIQDIATIKQDVSLQCNQDDVHNQSKICVKKVTVRTGWSPESTENVAEIDDNDPIIVQINIVRDYINQAKKAERFEEVAVLTDNLKSLKQAYREQWTEQEKQKASHC